MVNTITLEQQRTKVPGFGFLAWERFCVVEKVFCFMPKRCELSNKIIFLNFGIRLKEYTRIGHTRPRYKKTHWHNSKEHTVWMLKNF